ncbi:MAG: LysM peptidoglycan-binding domain-containing protein, partial [Candidatus Zixiibacteriota bacterium]
MKLLLSCLLAAAILAVVGCASTVRQGSSTAVAQTRLADANSSRAGYTAVPSDSTSAPIQDELYLQALEELGLAEEYYQYGAQANAAERWQEAQYNFERSITILSALDYEPDVNTEYGQRYAKLLGEIRSEYKLTLLYLATIPGETSSSAFVDRFEEIDDFTKLRQERVVTDVDQTETYDIPIVMNEKVENCIIYFQTIARDFFQAALTRSGKYTPIMSRILKEEGLPTDLVYLPLIESGYKTNAYSWAKATGPWQFISGTGKQYGLYRNWWYDERRDYERSTHAAARYLSFLYNRYDDWYLALAAYNSGEGRIDRATKREGTTDYWRLKGLARETKDYVPLFLAATIIAKNPEKYGFTPYYDECLEFETVTVGKCVDLRHVAKAIGTTHEYLTHLNPELLRNITPPGIESYRLRIPKNTESSFWAAYDGFEEPTVAGLDKHTIRRGETWSGIAKKYGISSKVLAEANNTSTKSTLIAGKTLLIPIKNSELARSNSSQRKSNSSSSKKATVKSNGDYVVRKGDNLWQIAEAHGTTVNDLRSLNGLGPYAELQAGQVIKVNSKQSGRSSKSSGNKIMTYKVKKGDTLAKIAAKYGTSTQEIASI